MVTLKPSSNSWNPALQLGVIGGNLMNWFYHLSHAEVMVASVTWVTGTFQGFSGQTQTMCDRVSMSRKQKNTRLSTHQGVKACWVKRWWWHVLCQTDLCKRFSHDSRVCRHTKIRDTQKSDYHHLSCWLMSKHVNVSQTYGRTILSSSWHHLPQIC